jgi:hypothetical protein
VPERLREVPQGEPPRAQQLLGGGCEGPRPEGRGERRGVDGDQPVQPAQVERHDPGEAGAARGEAADDRGAATEGHHRDPVPGADPQHGEDLGVVGRQDDDIRRVARVAGPQPDQVGGGPAAGVPDPALVVVAHLVGTDGGDERGARRRRQLGRWEPDVGQRDGLPYARRHAERLLQQRHHPGRELLRPRRVAPAVPEHVARPHRHGYTVTGGVYT